MSVSVEEGVIHLRGHSSVEDAEPLLLAFQDDPGRSVDLTQVIALHMAVAQIIMVIRPALVANGDPGFVADVLIPAMRTELVEQKDTGPNGSDL